MQLVGFHYQNISECSVQDSLPPGIQLHLSLVCGKGLQMQAASSSKASETNGQSSRRHIPEDCDLHQCCKNFNHVTGSCLRACGMKQIHVLCNRFYLKFSDYNNNTMSERCITKTNEVHKWSVH